MNFSRKLAALLAALVAGAAPASRAASLGLLELPADDRSGPVTVFYPAEAAALPQERIGIRFDAAPDASPRPGNGRLVVISHGSGALPWVQLDLARDLVAAGFTVAMPIHAGDNAFDMADVGPASWARRPLEVSRAIDRLRADGRFGALDYTRVGMYGMSAGGHTALVLAGGQWSPAGLRDHCRAHIDDDFAACAGTVFELDGGWLDRFRKVAAVTAIEWRFGDATPRAHADARIVAIVAGVPYAADFDMATLKAPAVPLALVTAGADRWLAPRFHGEAVLAACATCERLLDLPNGGHGALLSPLPPKAKGAVARLIADPPAFDRAAEVPRVDRAIVGWFERRLGVER
ncbi:alpha/beta hydrolase family protein [Derxia gummosa]|uniref:Alpha/beta hydrolase family protein n=1 Tax=Derxia gummosa DSM 723 TaxID=1121388 RepID=A0A8B6X5J4_9BURK|nr:dienelactone hydrolase [Derxia gummosa]